MDKGQNAVQWRGEKLENTGQQDRENEPQGELLSGLNEDDVVTEDLDLDTVLREVVDGARTLTGARIGGLTTLDHEGRLQDFITSGLTPEEHEAVLTLPGGPELFAYLSNLPQPVRLADFSERARAAGLLEIGPPLGPVKSFLAAPIRHRGRHVGNLYLSDKQGGTEFTDEDERVLSLFASHAAMSIDSVRRHREEQRARASLETLVDISPVGVVVFDAATASPVLLNLETRRIADALSDPGQTAEQLLNAMAFRRADGREVSLDEFPLAQALAAGETLRAEEIVLKVPDGRSITVLVNATPIRSESGEVESMVVTMQDMTPLEELARLRADFLAMVSHELRAPLTSIKGSAATLVASANSLDPAVALQFYRIIDEQADHIQSLITDLLDVARIGAGVLSVSPEPTDATYLVDLARSTFLSAGGRNNISIDLPLDLPRVMADRRRVAQVLGNLLSNAASHSPESSAIRVSAAQQGVHVAFSVADDGVGISSEILPRLFHRFSPMDGEGQSSLAGSGLGLAICKGIVEAHGGRIWAESQGTGMGARFTFTIPAVGETVYPSPVERTSLSVASGRPRGQQIRILAVEDEPQTLRYLRDALAAAGYQPIATGNPEEVGALVREERPHLVLLDLMLPGADGIELMESVPELAEVPVIFLSAYGGDQIVARALQAGADDYMVKPFSPTELMARIQAALRRRTPRELSVPEQPYVLGDLIIDYIGRRVSLAGHPVQVTAIEYDLLFQLSVAAGRVVPHEYLLQRVWGPGHPSDFGPVRTVVRNLRRKLGDDAESPTYIFTEPRVGYRMPRSEGRETESA